MLVLKQQNQSIPVLLEKARHLIERVHLGKARHLIERDPRVKEEVGLHRRGVANPGAEVVTGKKLQVAVVALKVGLPNEGQGHAQESLDHVVVPDTGQTGRTRRRKRNGNEAKKETGARNGNEIEIRKRNTKKKNGEKEKRRRRTK